MYLLSKFEDTSPCEYLEKELNGTEKYWACVLVHAQAPRVLHMPVFAWQSRTNKAVLDRLNSYRKRLTKSVHTNQAGGLF